MLCWENNADSTDLYVCKMWLLVLNILCYLQKRKNSIVGEGYLMYLLYIKVYFNRLAIFLHLSQFKIWDILNNEKKNKLMV